MEIAVTNSQATPTLTHLSGKTWVLVADAARARVFELSHDRRELREIRDLLNAEGRGRTEFDDRLPRTNESGGAARHAIEPHTPFRRKVSERFAHQIATSLLENLDAGSFEHLIVVAGPRFLGELHECVGDRVKRHIVAEIRKDLTKHLPPDIYAHLPAFSKRLPPAAAFAR